MLESFNVDFTLSDDDARVLRNMANASKYTFSMMIQDIVAEAIHDAYLDFGEDD